MRIAFVASEMVPLAKTGGLADVVGTLPFALQALGHHVDVYLPAYRDILKRDRTFKGLSDNILMTTLDDSLDCYLIKHDGFFGREGYYGDGVDDYTDNAQRFQYFCETTLKAMTHAGAPYDIIHCHDWHTALIPVYLRHTFADDSFFKQTKSVLTIHNLAFQGVFPKNEFDHLKLPDTLLSDDGFLFFEQVNWLKAGILAADEVTTVSPQYSKEIQTKEFGCGLEDVLSSVADHERGILNGLDYDYWNPENDPRLFENYTPAGYRKGKKTNKTKLQELTGLAVGDAPLFGFVGRISHQKGLDLILESLVELMQKPCQIVMQGIGDIRYQSQLVSFNKLFPQNFHYYGDFDEVRAHQIYAASDFFMMPSTFEPCGLGQMIAMRYGTVPVVSARGGLADTVKDLSSDGQEANGFVFAPYAKKAFLNKFDDAIENYGKPDVMERLITNGLGAEFSWKKSAEQYTEIYQCMLSD